MDELRRRLEEEARRVDADPDALEGVRRRAGRRRVSRQVGTGVLALAVAAGGFALAVVAAPEALQTEADGLASRLADAGYDVADVRGGSLPYDRRLCGRRQGGGAAHHP